VLPKPQAGFLGREGRGEKREKGITGGKRVGRKGKGAVTAILQEGRQSRHVAKE